MQEQLKEENLIQNGLTFILNHFEEPIWPRTISTTTTEGRQVLIYNKEESLARFKQANFIDCKINAYPDYIGFGNINRQSPNFIFIDIDLCSFNTTRQFKLAVDRTIKNIKDNLGAVPTVIWTGNGIHIYQPVKGPILELESLYSEFNQPSQAFLKFAEKRLSNYKSDPSHNPTFKSCMIRVPGSNNHKFIHQNNSANSSAKVKIMQRWDGYRPKTNPLLYEFYIYLADRKIEEINLQAKMAEKYKSNKQHPNENATIIAWIEKLLQTPIDDYRKNAVWRILAPYLINVKKLKYDEAFCIIKDWLNKCNSLKHLEFNPDYYIKYNLNNSIRVAYLPVKFDKVKSETRSLYDKLNVN